MSWDQETSRESIQQFLLSFLEIDVESLLKQAIKDKLDEQDLSFEVTEDESRTVPVSDYSEGVTPRVIRFSDGRVFVETVTHIMEGDAWGSDHYSFVEAGKPYVLRTETYDVLGVEEPQVFEERMPGEPEIPFSLEEAKERANAESPGRGDEIEDFLERYGLSANIYDTQK